MIKKIALIVLFVGVTVGVAYLLYRFFFAGAPTTTLTPGVTTPPIGGLPTAGTGQPPGGVPTGPTGLPSAGGGPTAAPGAAPVVSTLVTPDFAAHPIASPGGGVNYYDQSDGKFYHTLPDGTRQALSQQAFPSVSHVVWSSKGDKAVIEFPDSTKVLYDFSAQKQVTVPSHWQETTFNSDGSAIIAKSVAQDPDNRWLIAMAADGSSTKLLAALGENQDKVTVSVSPDNSIVAFSDTGDSVGFDSRDLLPIGQNEENFKALRVEGFGFTPEWSPDGKHLLYSTAEQQDNYLPTLWFQVASGNDIGGGRTNLQVHTWADKCTFADSSTVFCAVPDTLPEGAGLQRDIADGTADHIERIDLQSGSARTISQPGAGSITSVTVSSDGGTLFMAGADGHLTQLALR